MSLIHNERVKLRANALDRLSTAVLAVGVFGQVFDLAPIESLRQGLGMAGWFFGALSLHLTAVAILGTLRP